MKVWVGEGALGWGQLDSDTDPSAHLQTGFIKSCAE